jgi:hypothetical protein
MTDMSQGSWLWAAKGVGAIAGSAASRFIVGVMCGVVFGGTAGLKVATDLGIEERIGSSEMVLMGSALASLCAWWALGFVLKLLGQYRPDRPRRDAEGGDGHES